MLDDGDGRQTRSRAHPLLVEGGCARSLEVCLSKCGRGYDQRADFDKPVHKKLERLDVALADIAAVESVQAVARGEGRNAAAIAIEAERAGELVEAPLAVQREQRSRRSAAGVITKVGLAAAERAVAVRPSLESRARHDSVGAARQNGRIACSSSASSPPISLFTSPPPADTARAASNQLRMAGAIRRRRARTPPCAGNLRLRSCRASASRPRSSAPETADRSSRSDLLEGQNRRPGRKRLLHTRPSRSIAGSGREPGPGAGAEAAESGDSRPTDTRAGLDMQLPQLDDLRAARRARRSSRLCPR